MLETLRNLFPHRTRDERGASAVEYGLLVAGIAAVIVAVVFFLGGTVTSAFTETCSSIQNTGDTTQTCDDPADEPAAD